MSKYTKQDIIRIVEEEDVEFIRLQFTDMFGTLKNVAITSSQLEKALNNECMFDGSSIEGFVRIEESDMYLYPDLDTFVIFPWRPQQGKVARIICDIYTADRKPFEGDPRYALKKAVADAESMGYRFDVGPECEFFLFNQDEDGQPTTMSTERAGYFDLGPVDLGENARRDMVLTLEDMGYEIEASHHEVAPAQHEIDFKYDEALKTADNIMTFKLAVKTIAKRHGMFASFMPKPKYGVNGSGMHVNMSLSKEGRNIFDDPDGENGLSREAFWFIGGIMNHMRAMTAITNPLVNSYKRLVPGYEAPIYIAWSMTNRSPLIRIPVSRGSRTRVELRCPDSAANPYLTLAVCLEAGLDGIRRQIDPPAAVTENIFEMRLSQIKKQGIESLPADLGEAVEAFKADPYIREVLGEHISEKYSEAKMAEWADYRAQVTGWEIDNYLYKIYSLDAKGIELTNIIVAFPKQDNARNIKKILMQNGHHVDAVCSTGAQVLQSAGELGGGIVVCGYRFVDMMYTELHEYLPVQFEMLLVASPANCGNRDVENLVCLATPLKVNELLDTVEMMEYTITRRRKKLKQIPKERTKEEQELINEAKALLMERNNLSEEEAHRYIQKRSMDNGTGLTETAQMILSLLA